MCTVFQTNKLAEPRRETNNNTTREASRVYVRRIVKICGTGDRHNQDELQ